MKKQLLSIIVPCYNEEEAIHSFLEAIQNVEKQMTDYLTFNYLFIDDGSTDNTLEVLRRISQTSKNINYISFSRNFGKEAALLAGLQNVEGDLISVMDADLQDPPELLIEMYKKVTEGYDVVGTQRSNRTGEPIIRSIFATFFYKIMNIVSNIEMVDGARDFRLMTKQVVDSILELNEVNRFSKGIFSWVGYKTTYISYKNRERIAGQTSWNFWNLLRYSIDGFVNFSEVPLNISIWAGLCSFLLSILGIIFVIIRKLTSGDNIAGWASLVTIVLFLGGVQLLALGIIGKYLAKVFLEVKNRPHYIIQEKSN